MTAQLRKVGWLQLGGKSADCCLKNWRLLPLFGSTFLFLECGCEMANVQITDLTEPGTLTDETVLVSVRHVWLARGWFVIAGGHFWG